MPGRVRPSCHGKAGRAGRDPLGIDVGLRLAPLGGELKAGNAPCAGQKPRLRTKGTVAGNLRQPHQVGDFVDLVDLSFHQRDAFCTLAGMDTDAP
jgi:hypothetical protein